MSVRNVWKALAAVAAMAVCVAATARADDEAGGLIDWRISQSTDRTPAGYVKLHLRRLHAGGGQMNHSDMYPLEDLAGLAPAALSATGQSDVAFDFARKAGRLACEGRAGDGEGYGVCTFTENRAFADRLVASGLERPDQSEALLLTILDARIALLDDIAAAEYGRPEDLGEFIALNIHDVDGAFIREMSAIGVKADDLGDLIAFRIHDVTPAFVRSIRAIGPGFANADSDDFVAFSIHGVTPERAADFAALGYAGLAPDDLVAFQIHGVTPAFIREMRELGFAPDEEELVAFRIHRVSPQFVREMRALGFDDLAADDLVAFRIHGVTTDYLRGFTDNGFAVPSAEEVVRLKIAGFDPRRMKVE